MERISHENVGEVDLSEDCGYIASEHVSLTQELKQQHDTAIKEVREILKLLNHDSSMEDQDLLSTIASLKNAVENIVNDCAQDEDENDVESNENCILDVDGLIDETLILEVRLKNAETLSDNLKRKSQKLQSSLKQSERKSSQLGFKLATAEVKIKFLEDQVCLLEKDLKREHMGTSDNLNDAIEERNIAIKEKNEAWIQLSETKGELIQTNQQLLEVINQKVKLGQQLETWQIDMQKVLEEQIELKLAKNVALTQF